MNDVLREVLLPKLDGIRKSGGSYMARCPAHDDGRASLSVTEGKEHPVVLKCHAGCEVTDILARIGLTWEDLCKPREDDPASRDDVWTPNGPAVAVYPYHDEHGRLLFEVLRSRGKKFSQRVPDPKARSGWSYRLGDTRRVLFHLPKLLEDIASGMPVFVVEGEKDVLALERAGCTATCNPGGAGKWRDEYSEFLRDAIVHVVADRDEPGQRHARQVFASLQGVAACAEIVEAAAEGVPDGRRIKDASDHLEAGFTVADFVVTRQEHDEAPDLAPDLHEFLAVEDEPYDWLIPHILERGDRLIWTGTEGTGKALALDTPVPTPKGWTTMGELSAGDEVFGADGTPVRVTFATPVMHGHTCYRVTFSDGASIVADGGHLWLTETLAAREARQKYARKTGGLKKRGTDQRHKRRHFPAIVTTEEIRDTLMARNGHALNHSVATCSPLQYPAQELPLDPYLLGVWLGDGHSTRAQLVSHAGDVPHWMEAVRNAGFIPTLNRDRCPVIGMTCEPGPGRQSRSFTGHLRRLGVLGNKHIPRVYMESSADDRLALLQGLMDTDGWVDGDGKTSGRGSGASTCEFCVVSEPLARDVHELLLSLGIKVVFRSAPAVLEGREVGARYRLTFQTDLPVFRLPRKAERLVPLRTRRAKLRYITSVEPVESVPVRCIGVDSEDHLYLAGRECVPTHNSVEVRVFAVCVAAGLHPFDRAVIKPGRVLFIDCENSERKTRKHFRHLEKIARIKGRRVPDGNLRIICRPEGVDLLSEDGAAWLLERVTAHKPDLLCIGPFYRLHHGDMNDERCARLATVVLDRARVKADCALITEHHAPHGEGPVRSVRPVGSSLLMRWPELGMGIRRAENAERAESGHYMTVDVVMWRGPRDDDYRWPRQLTFGSREHDWPWVDPATQRLRVAPGYQEGASA